MSVVSQQQAIEKAALKAAWLALEEQALEPSPMATWAFAGTANEVLPEHRRPTLFFARTAEGTLKCAVPLRLERWRWRPLARLATSRWGDMPFLGVPLVHAQHAGEFLDDLFDMLRLSGIGEVEFRHMPARGPFFRSLQEAMAKKGLQPAILDRWERAVLDAARSPDEWWRQDIPKRRRKEWTRLQRRLREQGEVRFERLSRRQNCLPWLEDFMALEQAGWKGRQGTALACREDTRAFVQRMVPAFHERGTLEFFRLRLDGRTIASSFGLRQRGVVWLVKIAFDESLARFSPGVQLIIELSRALLADENVHLVDSCAVPDHPMINHLWRQRQPMVDVLVPLPHLSGRRLALLAQTEMAYRRLREQAARPVRVMRHWRRKRRHQ